MDNLVIRNIKENDISKVIDIKISGWKTAYKGIVADDYLNSFDRNKMIDKMKNDYKDSGFIVAELNDEIVGFCRYIDNNTFSPDIPKVDCEILALYAKPELKYNGIGTKLFKYVIEQFKYNHKTRMIIWCLNDNEPSKRFYKKMGGEEYREKVVEIGNKNYFETGFVFEI